MQSPVPAAVTRKELRSFSLIVAGGLCLFFGILIPWVWHLTLPVWPWIVAGSLVAVGLIAPGILQPLYKVWMFLGHMLGWMNTRILLSLVFFLIVTPISLLMRLFGGDPMQRKRDADLDSYRIASRKPPVEHLEKPF